VLPDAGLTAGGDAAAESPPFAGPLPREIDRTLGIPEETPDAVGTHDACGQVERDYEITALIPGLPPVECGLLARYASASNDVRERWA
jgi:hypothetical protein